MIVALLALVLTLPADLPAGAVAVFGSPRPDSRPQVLSPDGTRLGGVVGGRQVVVPVVGSPADAGEPADHADRAYDLAWPEGGDLCWVAWQPAGFACFARRPDGTVVGPTARPAAAADRLHEARLSPDGRTVLALWGDAGGGRRRLEVWPFEAGKGSHELARRGTVESEAVGVPALQAVRFSGDGSHLLVIGSGKLHGFDLRTGKPAWELAPAGGVGRFAASADGRAVVTVTVPEPGRTETDLWDGPTGRHRRRLAAGDGPPGGVALVAVTPDGKRVAVLVPTADGRTGGTLVDLATGKTVRTLNALPLTDPPAVLQVNISGDGRRLAVFGFYSSAVWDLTTGADARPGGGHRGRVTAAVFSRDGRWVVTAGEDRTVRCWSAATGAERWAVGGPAGVWSLVLAPDGEGVLLPGEPHPAGRPPGGSRVVRLADGRPFDLPPALAGAAASLVAFSPDGRTAAAVDATGFRLFDWPAGRPRRAIPFPPPIDGDQRMNTTVAGFSDEGTELVAVSLHTLPRPPGARTNPRQIERYAVATGERLSAVTLYGAPLLVSAFGRRAYFPVGAGADPDPAGVLLRDVAGGAEVGRLDRPGLRVDWAGAGVRTAARPDNRRLLVTAADGVQVFDPADGLNRGVWPPAPRRVTALAFSRDGTRLVTGDAAGVCIVWDADRHLP